MPPSRTLRLVRRAIDKGRAAFSGLRTASPPPSGFEEALSNLLAELTTAPDVRLRIVVQGKPRALTLTPAIEEQLCLIVREGVMNALRHSGGTIIEIQIQYLHNSWRLFIRDNGCGIDPDRFQKTRDWHWGLCGMRERSEGIGARFGIWSRPGAGTEVRIVVPVGAGN